MAVCLLDCCPGGLCAVVGSCRFRCRLLPSGGSRVDGTWSLERMGRVEEALKRFRGLRPGGVEGQGQLPDLLRRPELMPFPPPDVFVSPWQFAPTDGARGASAGSSGPELQLAESLIPLAAVRYDLDPHACQTDPAGRFAMQMWLPGVEPRGYPPKIDCAELVEPSGGARFAPTADLDEAGANLAMACHVAGATFGQPSAWRAHEVQTRLARRIAAGQAAPLPLTQAVFEDLLVAVGAGRGRLVVKTPDVTQPVLLAVVGSWPATIPLPDLEPARTEFGPDWIVTTAQLAGGGAAGAEFQAFDGSPLTRGQALVAEAGMTVLGTWLSGVTSATSGRLAERISEARPAGALDAAADGEMERVKRLSLKGGVLVARFSNGGPPGAWAVTSVIDAMREELRSSDLLGQLPTGEITALLVRASADGVVSAAWRVKERLEELVRERRLPPIELGHALYPDGGAESLSALVERARSYATCGAELPAP